MLNVLVIKCDSGSLVDRGRSTAHSCALVTLLSPAQKNNFKRNR